MIEPKKPEIYTFGHCQGNIAHLSLCVVVEPFLYVVCFIVCKVSDLGFLKLSDFVVYPLHLPGAGRKEGKRWAIWEWVWQLCAVLEPTGKMGLG